MKLSKQLIGFASAFVSFVLPKLGNIREIILFGSVARGEADKNSDIDLFFSIEKKEDEEEIRGILKREIERFYKSKLAEQWVIHGMKNKINFEVGILDEWGLKRSIISDGIVLYGKYREIPSGQKHYSLFVLNPIKNITKRNRVIREIFGRNEKNYSSKGMIDGSRGKKLSSSSFIVPAESSKEIIKFLSKEKASYQIYEIWSDNI